MDGEGFLQNRATAVCGRKREREGAGVAVHYCADLSHQPPSSFIRSEAMEQCIYYVHAVLSGEEQEYTMPFCIYVPRE